MKGNNTLLLNEATMIAAVQEYLDKRWSSPDPSPVVKSVKPSTSGNYETKDMFKVEICEDTLENAMLRAAPAKGVSP